MNSNLTTVLYIAGMTCEHCARRVRAVILAQPGVLGTNVHVRAGTATVVHDDPLALDALVQDLAEQGYEARLARLAPAT
ncbi:MAG: heavy metal-associated domain-containing protein [Planctomycetota bacterium]